MLYERTSIFGMYHIALKLHLYLSDGGTSPYLLLSRQNHLLRFYPDSVGESGRLDDVMYLPQLTTGIAAMDYELSSGMLYISNVEHKKIYRTGLKNHTVM